MRVVLQLKKLGTLQIATKSALAAQLQKQTVEPLPLGGAAPLALSDLGYAAALPGVQGKRAAVAGSTDEALLARLGDVVQGMKDDFMVVHFRESCSYCRNYLSDEPR